MKTTINPAEIIKSYAKKMNIPARDVFLHIQLDDNDVYSEECVISDWLVNEGIIIDKENNVEMIPMYYERNGNEKNVIAMRGK